MTRLVAQALAQSGEAITVITRSAGSKVPGASYTLLRRPAPAQLMREYRKADVVVLQGLTLRLGWPLLFRRAAAMAVHHMRPVENETRLGKHFRHRLARRVRHTAVSQGLARELPWTTDTVLPNPYESAVFQKDETIPRDRDLIFVGRLVPEKGVEVLLKALACLRQDRQLPTVAIVGEGPQKGKLEEMARATGVEASVTFAGQVIGTDLARMLNRHRLLVLPSIHQEPFGLVALEAIACGCVAIGSHAGGIPEAIGPCGTTFQAGDAAALAATIHELLRCPEARARFQAQAQRHLAKHQPCAVGANYRDRLRICLS